VGQLRRRVDRAMRRQLWDRLLQGGRCPESRPETEGGRRSHPEVFRPHADL